ncbi:acyltransferase [Salsipaludibacter albus]|uniref:acyltransferase n=1 Tax=Salsipaludibacter albus TaxID=2849650 RepID=UPI001EE46BC1|nr:hypothetical protein [Salsipaludibacter albus]
MPRPSPSSPVVAPVAPVQAVDDEPSADHALAQLRELLVAREVGREGLRRATRLAHDAAVEAGLGEQFRRPPPRLRYPRFGWREAIRRGVDRHMWTRDHVATYPRWVAHRARAAALGQDLVAHGMVFTGRDVHLRARAGAARLVLGPWCWIGDRNRLRVHEGQLVLGAKVVLGTANQVNTWLDVEIGDQTLLADHIYLCDFDHRVDRLDVAIKDQGIVTAPVRIGPDCWIGEKSTVLRGVDVGRGVVVGSQSVVRDDLPPFAIAVGRPARPVRSRLPDGVDPDEAAALLARGLPVPGDPLED